MIEAIVIVVTSALLSSGLTLGLAWWIWRRRLAARLETRLEELGVELAETVRAGVRQGVLEGIADAPSLEVISGAGRTMAESAVEALKGGLDTILGPSPDRKE